MGNWGRGRMLLQTVECSLSSMCQTIPHEAQFFYCVEPYNRSCHSPRAWEKLRMPQKRLSMQWHILPVANRPVSLQPAKKDITGHLTGNNNVTGGPKGCHMNQPWEEQHMKTFCTMCIDLKSLQSCLTMRKEDIPFWWWASWWRPSVWFVKRKGRVYFCCIFYTLPSWGGVLVSSQQPQQCIIFHSNPWGPGVWQRNIPYTLHCCGSSLGIPYSSESQVPLDC